MSLKISDIKIVPIRQQGSLWGFATVLINNVLELQQIGIHTRPSGGWRATFPAKKLKDGRLQFFYRFIDTEAEDQLTQAITSKIRWLGLWEFELEENEN